MPSPETTRLLNTCENRGTGCFADYPESLDGLPVPLATEQAPGDATVQTVIAAFETGRAGLPFEAKDFDPQDSRRIKCAQACGAAATCPLFYSEGGDL